MASANPANHKSQNRRSLDPDRQTRTPKRGGTQTQKQAGNFIPDQKKQKERKIKSSLCNWLTKVLTTGIPI